MNILRKSVRSWAIFNRYNVLPSRQMSSDDDFIKIIRNLVNRVNPKEKSSHFNTVTENTIHRMNFIDGMPAVVYPGSMSTVPKETRQYLRKPSIDLGELIDFDDKKARNKLSILTMKCPTLLFETLKKVYPVCNFFDMYITQLSYENYGDSERGRKDCLLANNEICIQLVRMDNWAYFSASTAPINPDDEHLYLYKCKSFTTKKNLAKNLHVKVTLEDRCVLISSEPLDNTAGLIYTNQSNGVDILRLMSVLRKGTKMK